MDLPKSSVTRLLCIMAMLFLGAVAHAQEWAPGSILGASAINWTSSTNPGYSPSFGQAGGDVVVMQVFVVSGGDGGGETQQWNIFFGQLQLQGAVPTGSAFSSSFFASPSAKSVFTPSQKVAALELIKKTLPRFYDKYIKNATINSVPNLKHNGNTASGNSFARPGGAPGIINYNADSTPAFDAFRGTKEQFIALVIVHEALHIYYFESLRSRLPDASSARGEASVRYWVEDWAIKNGIPETSPNARANGQPNYSAIYQQVVNDGYNQTTNFQATNPGGPPIGNVAPYEVGHFFRARLNATQDQYAISPGSWVTFRLQVEDLSGVSEFGIEVYDQFGNHIENLGPIQLGGAASGDRFLSWISPYYGQGAYKFVPYYWTADRSEKIVGSDSGLLVYDPNF